MRHGTALHNINFPKIGRKAYTEFRDTPLVDFGHIESITLGQEWRDIGKIELVVVSPLTRTLQTAQNIFNSKPNIPMLAIDYIKEHPQSEETCNYRQARSALQVQFPSVDFTNITEDEDTAFQVAKRSDNVELELLHKRIDTFKKWIASRSDISDILRTTHQAWENAESDIMERPPRDSAKDRSVVKKIYQ